MRGTGSNKRNLITMLKVTTPCSSFSRQPDKTSGCLNIHFSTYWFISYCCDWIIDMYPTKTRSMATFASNYVVVLYRVRHG